MTANLIEQEHRFIIRRVRHMCGFKLFNFTSATLEVIEVSNMLRKRQFQNTVTSGFLLFAEIAEYVRLVSRRLRPL
nr:DDE-type integrase/transposase/recombinase [Ruegeria atlantica]